ncbi:mitochondrial splicing system protein [Xylographa bjoerkii]|nr:mitochondrial splicing system protein [Xylographa bjoerkii]
MRKARLLPYLNCQTRRRYAAKAVVLQLCRRRIASWQAPENGHHPAAFPSRSSISLPKPGARSISVLNGDDSTIFALSTAPGRAAIAIIRVSGPQSLGVYNALCPGKAEPRPRYASLRTLYEPFTELPNRQVLDPGSLVFYFPAPNTVTGEDVLEFHIHGGPAIVKAVLAAIVKVDPLFQSKTAPAKIRYAEPGEFTRRAFYNNRLDLTQIEALGDSLSAETEQQRRLAVNGTTNKLTERYETWRSELLYARGELEALIDFSEDQHFEESPRQLIVSVEKQVKSLNSKLTSSINNAFKGELLRNGIRVALLGAPNAGKSSLLNRIVGREAAIVSHEPGTTRDVIEISVDIGGFLCKIGDLAGLRRSSSETTDEQTGSAPNIGKVELEGIRRARRWILDADVIIVVLPVQQAFDGSPICKVSVDPEILRTLAQHEAGKQKLFFVVNKIDLISIEDEVDLSEVSNLLHTIQEKDLQSSSSSQSLFDSSKPTQRGDLIRISCKEGLNVGPRGSGDSSGIQDLLDGLSKTFATITAPEGLEDDRPLQALQEESLGASERHRLLLVQCQGYLDAFCNHFSSSQDIDVVLAAEELRGAADCLAKISGKGEAGDVEEVLGVVFEKWGPPTLPS